MVVCKLKIPLGLYDANVYLQQSTIINSNISKSSGYLVADNPTKKFRLNNFTDKLIAIPNDSVRKDYVLQNG